MVNVKEMEYEQASSGFVTLYNYKEPFMPFENGYGFYGTLLFDGKTDNVQCHLCGGWFNYLPHHLHKEHNMNANDYKTKVGLGMSSALLSESARANLIQRGLEKRLKNLRPNRKHSDETREKIKKNNKEGFNRMEYKNKFGTCPLQLLDRLNALAKKLGRTPGTREVGFMDTLRKVFGSYKEACRRAKLEIRKPGANIVRRNRTIFTDEQLIESLRFFKERENRYPTSSDAERGLLIAKSELYRKRFKKWGNALDIAFPDDDIQENKKKAREEKIKKIQDDICSKQFTQEQICRRNKIGYTMLQRIAKETRALL